MQITFYKVHCIYSKIISIKSMIRLKLKIKYFKHLIFKHIINKNNINYARQNKLYRSLL